MNVLTTLKERGFVAQCSNEEELSKALDHGPLVYYIGFDPTASSLHVGSLVPIMAMVHLQRAGHKPIAILGGGTTLIGDPSGKTMTRPILTQEEIEQNAVGIKEQLERYLVLDGTKGILLNNADWLVDLKYIEFLRDVGRCFRVNDMIRAEGYRQRLEREEGLSFIEFNYQLLQSYDFLVLFDRYQCTLQMGGDDQWGNIRAGLDLVRRLRGRKEVKKGEKQKGLVFGLTFPLIMTARGNKMGKTEAGTVWLDAQRTSPYQFYQYWINTDDRDVERFLLLYTFLTVSEIEELCRLKGEALRPAKEILAYEVTRLAHGVTAADESRDSSWAVFGGGQGATVPTTAIQLPEHGIKLIDLLCQVGFADSRGAARRLITQHGVTINGQRPHSIDQIITAADFLDGVVTLRRGKKQFHRVTRV